MKFSLGGDRGLGVLLGGTATSAVIGCTAAPTDSLIEVPAANPGANQFSFDPSTGLYQFNWKTDKAWANRAADCSWADDGTVHSADFHLK